MFFIFIIFNFFTYTLLIPIFVCYRPTEVPVYNLTNDEVVSYKWFDILDLSKKIGRDYPFEWQVWYPNGSMCATYREYFIWSIFLHWLPAVFIDVLLFLLFQERM